MSLITVIQINNGTTGQLVMPASTAFPKRKIFGMYGGHEGITNGCVITVTNVIADTGATFTTILGSNTSGGTSGVQRGFTVDLPYKGLPCSTVGTTTISVLLLATTTFTLMIDYERG